MSALAIAHRAGNSLEGLRTANALRADVIECDVHEHRGRIEVRHLKTAGPLPFLWDRGQLVSASAPRLGLDQLLEADHHGTTLMLDLKGRRISTARAVVTLLRQVAHERPMLVCGRHWSSVDAVASLPGVRPVMSARNRLELNRLRRRLATGARVHGASIHRSLLDEDLVADLHDRVDTVMTWPVNTVACLDSVLAMGVTGVISDEQDVLSELISRRG
ncbi:MAG: glycerophosphodiester phosphodiesterase [Nocardioidaceae bacterium]|nr:glycerophosphodiester phosphodiesterase [Nocardioidaceae bacterium]